jgi:hypothetical protein
MIHSENSARSPEARVLDLSSSAAELLDDNFMDQFETVNPNDLHFQQDPNHWATQPQDEAFNQWDFFLYPSDPDTKVALKVDAQQDTRSEQGLVAMYQLHATQDPVIGMSKNSDTQQAPRSEQVPGAWDEVLYLQDPNDGTDNGTDLTENTQFPYSDQLDKQMENSNGDLQDPLYGIDFNPGLLLTSFEQPINTEDLNQDHFDQVAALSAADSDPLFHPQEPQVESLNPNLTWTCPAHYIEQPPVVQEVFPHAPCLSPHPSIHTPPDNKHLNGDNTLPPPPKRERSKGLPYKRRDNIESMDPSKFYRRLSQAPNSWKAHKDDNITFRYNEYGNLCTDDKYSRENILDYLYYHPLNCHDDNEYDPKNGGLTLWIQTVPADAAKRYPDKNSDKCRFANCPIQGGSIRKGFFRVAFDEQTRPGRLTDPYHCAGFVHLFCLEKFCNFPEICRNFNVQPDQRQFNEGKNKMAITRDHQEMAAVVRNFMQSSEKPESWDYEQTLNFQLTSKHLELQPKTRQNKRIERGGNHIELHKGDLEKFVEGESLKKEQRDAPKAKNPSKRKRDTSEEEGIANLGNGVTEGGRQTKCMMYDFR